MLNKYEYIPRQPSVSLSRERIVSHSPKIPSFSRQRIVSHSPKMSIQKSTLTTRGESSQANATKSTSFLAHSGIRNKVDLIPLACEDVRGDHTGVQAPKVKVGFRLPPLTAVSGDMKVNQLRRNRNVAELNKRKFRLPDVYAKIYGNNAKTGRDKYTVWENYRMKLKSDTHIKNDK